MSLFPAYGGVGQPAANDTDPGVSEQNSTKNDTTAENWQQNTSFNVRDIPLPPDIVAHRQCSDSNSSSSSQSTHNSQETKDTDTKRLRLEFNSSNEYYVDKKQNLTYHKLKTLPRLSRPFYKVILRRLVDQMNPSHFVVRFNSQKHTKLLGQTQKRTVKEKLSPEQTSEMLAREKELKQLIVDEPEDLSHWIELYRSMECNLEKMNRFSVIERQLKLIENALNHHSSNAILLELYIDTANGAYPASEVATKIEQLLKKDPFEYTLWKALIMTTQGTMSRCNVPDVLRIYEQSMRRMHLGQTERRTSAAAHAIMRVDTDSIMLKLFYNCVLFMRQSANGAHMFALLKLALEINMPGVNFDCFEAKAREERPLIEFEELVLQSGMPMPEIWTRIERLRQAFNFLPYPQLQRSAEQTVTGSLDPQRCVYNDDVCHYIFPLKSPQNKLQLVLLAIHLTKMPFVRTNSLADRLCARIDQIGESDAIEIILAGLCDRYTYAFPVCRNGDFTGVILDLVKEMCVSPTFMPHSIGSDLYVQFISKLLQQCANAFTLDEDERKRRVCILLFFRFERLLLILNKLSRKLTEQYLHDARLRIRKLMREAINRRVVRFYTELGMFEFELLERDDDDESVFRIFNNIISSQASHDPDFRDVDLKHTYVVYAEMLIARNKQDFALNLLTCMSLGQHAASEAEDMKPLRQQALDRNIIALESEVESACAAPPHMPLEDYFLSNNLLVLLKSRCLILCLLGQPNAATELLQRLLSTDFKQTGEQQEQRNERICFYREQLQELQLLVLQLPLPVALSVTRPSGPTGSALLLLLEQGLCEFPRNLVLLQRWSTLAMIPWYKLRARLVRTKAGILSLIHMIAAARCRFLYIMEHSCHYSEDRLNIESVLRNRILSMFEAFLPHNVNRSKIEADQYEILRRNSLYWRCYLRCLSDHRTSFQTSKECLLTALDECPWDKSLYLDGAMYVPQEITHLQDVMTEKQIRIYAIPEELDILRETQRHF